MRFIIRRSGTNGWVTMGRYDSLEIAKKQLPFIQKMNPLFHHQIIDEFGEIFIKD